MPVESPHDLYGLPLERFIPERAALAKALRGEKRRDEAGEVAALRKPSVAAWAVNQLVRTQAKAIAALFDAGDDLVRAQADAAAGKRAGDAIRDASRRQRETVSELTQAAERLLSSDGHPLSQTTLERVGDTLRAAAVDPEARQQVQDGRLTQELRFVGLGVGEAPAPAAARAQADRERKTAVKDARRAESEARQAAERAQEAYATAQTRRKEAAASLAKAERLLAATEEKAQQTAAELQNAERRLSELRNAEGQD